MAYLTRWRMLHAGDRLANSSDSIAVIARSLGYESESAFSTAFKRTMGSSPRQFNHSLKPFASAERSNGSRASDPEEIFAFQEECGMAGAKDR